MATEIWILGHPSPIDERTLPIGLDLLQAIYNHEKGRTSRIYRGLSEQKWKKWTDCNLKHMMANSIQG
jgi:hypothetical protein